MSQVAAVVTAIEVVATAVAELEGVPQWAIDGGIQVLGLVSRLISANDPKALDDIVDTLAEIGKAGLDARKFGEPR